MCKQLYAIARQLVTLIQNMQKLKAEHKELSGVWDVDQQRYLASKP
jgi:hypothetical protein